MQPEEIFRSSRTKSVRSLRVLRVQVHFFDHEGNQQVGADRADFPCDGAGMLIMRLGFGERSVSAYIAEGSEEGYLAGKTLQP